MIQDESIDDNPKTVVYRKCKKTNTIFALLPNVPSALISGQCYAHKDKWYSLDYDIAINDSVSAIESEYRSLHKHISALGHDLVIKQHEELIPKKDNEFEPSFLSSNFHLLTK